MGEEGRAIALALLSGIGLTGLWLTVSALFPGVVERSRRTADQSPGRAFLVGLVNLLFLGALGLGFSALADNSGVDFFHLPAVILYAVLIIMLAFGLTGLSQLIGGRLIARAHPVWQQVLGSWTVILGSLTPFIGWFALFPYLAALSIGSFLLGWVRGRRQASTPTNQPEQEVAGR